MAPAVPAAAPLATPEEIAGVEAWLSRSFPKEMHALWAAPAGTHPGLLGPFDILDIVEGPEGAEGGLPFFRTPSGKLVRVSLRDGAEISAHPVAGDLPCGCAAFVERARDPAWLAGLDLPRPQGGRLGAIAASALQRIRMGSPRP